MTWPTVAISTTNTDAAADSPASARADILDALTKLNQMMAHVSTFAATLLDDADAAAARATLGAAASGDNTDITSIAASGTVRGNTATGITTSAAVVGVASTTGQGVYGSSDSGIGVKGYSVSNMGVYGQSSSNLGVYGHSSSNHGGYFSSGAAKSPLYVLPASQPTGANDVGAMYVTTAGVLKICTVAGTPGTWVSVGSQT